MTWDAAGVAVAAAATSGLSAVDGLVPAFEWDADADAPAVSASTPSMATHDQPETFSSSAPATQLAIMRERVIDV